MTGGQLDGLRRAAVLVLVPLVCLLALPFLLVEAGPAYEARFGGGTEGVFTARTADCDEDDDAVCRWRGDFRSADGAVQRDDVALIGRGPDAVGDRVDAVDTGSDDAVYPEGGGGNWLVITLLLVVVVLALVLWWRALRRLRQARRTDSSAAP